MHATYTEESPAHILKTKFGYNDFRPYQEEIIRRILDRKDALVLMPTGGGKSICYQVPALLMEGVCLVVSPLIALMNDQVMALRANDIGAAALNSTLSREEAENIIADCRNEKIKLLYISPEKLIADIAMLTARLRISFVAVDEAHCISSWGHDFRPEYNQLHRLRSVLPGIPIMALTATADKVTRKDIITQLQLNDPAVFIASFNRPNIHLAVRSALTGKAKTDALLRFLRDHNGQSGIIYCMSRKTTEALSEKLRTEGFSAACYHAGMENSERNKVQEDFSNDRKRIICATIAFGMGIDKSNVRWVVHYNLPKNMEGYYQEIGRAGRDGEKADALLFYNVGDLVFLSEIAQKSGQAELNTAKLNRMQQFAEAPNCRRKILLGYFGEALQENCNNCDVCRDPRPLMDGTRIAQMALSAAVRTQEKTGINMLIDILRGSSKNEIFEHGYDKIKTYGVGRDYSFRSWQYYMLQLLNLGVFELAYDENFTLKVTAFGRQLLSGKATVQLGEATDTTVTSKGKRLRRLTEAEKAFRLAEKDTVQTGMQSEAVLFENLREVRTSLARMERVPAFVILSDAVLRHLSEKKPLHPEELQHISGMGENKIRKFGRLLLNTIRKFHGLPEYNGVFFEKEILLQPQGRASKGATYKETLRLYQEGKGIPEIAEIRGFHPNTILSHLVLLYERGEPVNPHDFVPQEIIDKVSSCITGNPAEVKELTPLFRALDEKVPFDMLRMALAVLRKK